MDINQINKKQASGFLLIVIAIQIILLLNMPVANSYQISHTDKLIKELIVKRDAPKNFVGKGLGLLVNFISISQIGSVSAQTDANEVDLQWNCCRKTIDGAICQDISSENPGLCDSEPIPTACENVGDCKLGCCFDSEEGLCTPKSTQLKCTEDGGIWESEENCLTLDCQKGCCVLGRDTDFVTETRCERLAYLEGFEKDFRDVQTELECLAIRETQSWGACLLDEGACKFGTEIECAEMGGSFEEDVLCADLTENCERQDFVGCFEGEDEIYWFDSCGNRENIYSSDREDSWNNGKLLLKNESCNPTSANIDNEDCGNCNYFLGSQCSASETLGKKVKDGDFICKSMKCIDEQGHERQNGESWCVYDSFIGDGKDPAGSRHWKRMCIDGEIKVEPCTDYRNQICVQSEIEDSDGDILNTASCVMNTALECIDYNSRTDLADKCAENPDCILKNVNVDDGFMFDICVPKYPLGFDLSGDENEESEMLCQMASIDCTMVYEKKVDGDWECIFNCDCEDKEFTQQMNDLCISMGDCGSYINYVGEGSDNIRVTRAPGVSWQKYKKYANPVEGQFAKPKNISDALMRISGNADTYDPENQMNVKITDAINFMGTVTGSIGGVIGVMSWAFGANLGYGSAVTAGHIATIGPGLVGPTLSTLGNFAAGVGIGMLAATLLTMTLGLEGDAAMVMTIAGAAAGITIGIIFAMQGEVSLAAFGPIGWIVLGILVALAAILKLFGIGDTKEKVVEFDCLPWQAPVGADDCDLCNGNPLKPCSKYRCESLGQACGFINEDTENPICVEIGNNDRVAPVISAHEIFNGYIFQNENKDGVEIRQSDGKCIPEFTPLEFSLKTDEYAQCKFDYSRMDFDDMNQYFAENTAFDKNHTLILSLPSIESMQLNNVSGNIIDKQGNFDMYVRCQDTYGNKNTKDYNVNICVRNGIDITPAWISTYIPNDNSYVAYNVSEINATLYLNEPAECRWDLDENLSYWNMENIMDCELDVNKGTAYGWPCLTTLTGFENSKENKFYIKCRDQPWLGPENYTRNINEEDSFVYTLIGSESELKITEILPQGEIVGGFKPYSVDLTAKTNGGAENGKSACYYSFIGYENMALFFNTFSNEHKQNFNSMMGGDYNIYVECEDIAGNIDRGVSSFRLKIDSTPPEVVRIYNEGGSLKIYTNEEADCYYDFNTCYFNTNNSTSMTTGFSTQHSAEWNREVTYHIKCVDIWNNKPDGCTVKVSPNTFN